MAAIDGPEAPVPGQRRSEKESRAGLRYLLLGEVGLDDCYDDLPLGRCVEIEGLFVDLPPRPREHFTLVGCAPEGALADLLNRLPAEALGTDQAWLGDVAVTEPSPPPGTPPVWSGEYLGDVIVLGQRPSTSMPGTVDVDLSGFVDVDDRTDAVRRPRDTSDFVLLGGGQERYGTCLDVTGVFRDQAAPPVPQVRLRGCRPAPALLTALDAIGQSTKAAERRRRFLAEVHVVAADGSTGHLVGAAVVGTVQASEPSRLGDGLLDITIDSDPREPFPTRVLDMLGHWRTGRPAEKNLWAGYDRELRHHWAGIALGRVPAGPDRPAGATYDLDGRFVTDIEGFYCAIGEAINGPGGYFGWNLDALDDCLHGGFGARIPFRLTWHNSDVARQHLVDGYDRRRLATAVSLQYLLDLLTAEQVEIDLR
ncbi:barstar family protein [Actinoplanes sp. NPDC049802]|uniref:barstar family protein n=1 Tax=Actinoplanes sp. NPDC049802 TaxID=3154742 RepID=UPI0033F60122